MLLHGYTVKLSQLFICPFQPFVAGTGVLWGEYTGDGWIPLHPITKENHVA